MSSTNSSHQAVLTLPVLMSSILPPIPFETLFSVSKAPIFTITSITVSRGSEYVKKSIEERALHTREYVNGVNERKMQSKEGKDDSRETLDAHLVVTESNETESETHVSSSRFRNDTHAEDAIIISENDKQPMAEVQLSAEHNILANEQQHYEQSEFIYDTYLLEKIDRNTTPDSIDMSHRGGEID
ncbi:hypothetical protein Tco_1009022 [Tanacetum coccineum]